MIDLPDGKALIAVDRGIQCNDECMDVDYKCPIDCCKGCDLSGDNPDMQNMQGIPDGEMCGLLCCISQSRRDGRNVHYKVVDYPGVLAQP